MMSNFNSIAKYYDSLARMVFGDSIVNAQIHFLPLIKPSSNVLVIGGGTGWILEELKIDEKSIKVWYIELSDQMLFMAKKTTYPSLNVDFIHGSEKDIPPGVVFDVVITNFFLDLFPEDKLKAIVGTIQSGMKPGAFWLVSDFVNEKYWHRIFLWIMYRFFKLTTRIEASVLPEWGRLLENCVGVELQTKHFFGGFIKSSVYKF